MTKYITSLISGAINNPRKEEKLKNMLQNSLGMELKDESETLLKEYLDNIRSLHPQTVTRQFYSDYVTPLEKDIYREGTKVHIMYALKMGPKYQKRYEKHFRNPDIRCFDMNHEAWMYDKKWVIPVLETIEQCMIQ